MSKISELTDGGSLLPTDFLIAVRSGGNVKVQADDITVDQINLGDNEFIRLGNSQDLTMVHNASNSIINQAGIGDLLLQKAGTTKASITANGLEFPDNSKAIFGAGSDLQIYHDGTDSFLIDNGTGRLNIRSSSDFLVANTANSQNYIYAVESGAVNLYHSGSKKFETTASGIDVTGSVTATGIVGASDGTNGEMQFGLGTALTTGAGTYDSSVRWNGSSGNLLFSQGAVEKMRITSTGYVEMAGAADVRLTLGSQGTAGNNDANWIRGNGTSLSYNAASANHIWETGGSEKARLDSDGKILIGDSASHTDDLLQIETPASGGGHGIQIRRNDNNTDQGVGRIQFGNNTATDLASISAKTDGASDNGALLFNTSVSGGVNTERLRIDSSGNVGIGCSPVMPLDVMANTGANAFSLRTRVGDDYSFFTFRSNDGTEDLGGLAINRTAASTSNLLFYTNNGGSAAERMRIDASGRVGIGGVPNTNWRNDLASQEVLMLGTEATLFSDGGVTTELWNNAYINNTDTIFNISTRGASRYQQYQGAHKWFTAASASAGTNINTELGTTPKMTLDVSGNLLLGLSSIGETPNQGFGVGISGSGNSGNIKTVGNGSHTHFIVVNTSNVVGTITSNSSSTAYNTSSDYRLKENVVGMSGATERLKQLKPSRFNFIADADTTVDGFLAHEVQDIVPEAITGTKDAMMDEEYEVTPAVLDDDGNVVTEAVMGTRSVPDYQGIDQSKLVPLLVATIQELEARIAALES